MLAALVLVMAACGDSGTTTTEAAPPTTSGFIATTTTGPPPTTTQPAVTSTTAGATTTTAAPTTTTTTTASGEAARFAISQVVFGENGYVAIANVGGEAGDVGGHWLCQRPNYFEVPPVTLEPGQVVWVATGDGATLDAAAAGAAAVAAADGRLGRFTAAGGEIALYASNTFSSAEDIRSYVEWGAAGGLPRAGRGPVAVEAGIWQAGMFVVVPPDAIGVTATAVPASGPQDWIGDFGG